MNVAKVLRSGNTATVGALVSEEHNMAVDAHQQTPSSVEIIRWLPRILVESHGG
jgi:hypothetical protein